MAEYTVREHYLMAKRQLAALPVDFPETEALLLLERFLGINGRAAVAVHGDEYPSPEAAAQLEAAILQRGELPLQYILGKWEFCDMQLAVGKGVLVPREDTMALVELAAEGLAGKSSPLVLDLCAGSGAVALGLSRLLPDARFVCVELSEEAMPFLKENVERYALGRVEIIKADVLLPPDESRFLPESFDAVVSNPPYIPAGDIPGLAREVRQEPEMALNGGEDGLNFYRAIVGHWAPLLKKGGQLSVELGCGQFEDVKGIFVRCGLTEIRSKRDFGGILRAINGTLL